MRGTGPEEARLRSVAAETGADVELVLEPRTLIGLGQEYGNEIEVGEKLGEESVHDGREPFLGPARPGYRVARVSKKASQPSSMTVRTIASLPSK